MASQIRVLLDARSGTAGVGDEGALVARVSIRFRTRGSPSSTALQNSPQPAKIELFSRFVDSGRRTQAGGGTSIGTVQGQLSLQNGRVVFACDPAALAKMNDDFVKTVDDSRQQQPRRPTRSLGLQLESPDFTGIDPRADPPHLLLPANPNNRSHLEVLAELTIAGQLEAPRDSNDIWDVPLRPNFAFPLPAQKRDTLLDVGPPTPILIASNDPSFIPGQGSIRDKIKNQNSKRNQDSSPETSPGGDFIPFHIVSSATRPPFTMDHGFLDDGHGNIDESKRQGPTGQDFLNKAKWILILTGAQVLRDDLIDGTDAYQHFLEASGEDFEFSYERFARNDRTGAHIVESAIDDTRAAAVELSNSAGGNHFRMQTDAVPAGC